MHPSDESLLASMRGGDLAAFDALYDRHARALFAFARRMLHDDAEAEDVLHEAFLALLHHADAGEASRALRPWLFTVTRNLCLNRLRARRRGALAVDAASREAPHEATPGDALEARETAERLRAAVARLPPALAEVYALRAGGASYEELCLRLDIPLGTVKSRVHEMVTRLREEMRR